MSLGEISKLKLWRRGLINRSFVDPVLKSSLNLGGQYSTPYHKCNNESPWTIGELKKLTQNATFAKIQFFSYKFCHSTLFLMPYLLQQNISIEIFTAMEYLKCNICHNTIFASTQYFTCIICRNTLFQMQYFGQYNISNAVFAIIQYFKCNSCLNRL